MYPSAFRNPKCRFIFRFLEHLSELALLAIIVQKTAIAEAVDDGELDQIRERLARVRS
jgi:hypothetical protein